MSDEIKPTEYIKRGLTARCIGRVWSFLTSDRAQGVLMTVVLVGALLWGRPFVRGLSVLVWLGTATGIEPAGWGREATYGDLLKDQLVTVRAQILQNIAKQQADQRPQAPAAAPAKPEAPPPADGGRGR